MILRMSRTVHIIEDDRSVRDSLETLLDAWGYSTRSYGDAEAFVEASGLDDSGLDDSDLIILDLILPGKDGRSVLRWLDETQRKSPTLLITGTRKQPLAQLRKSHPDLAILTKPLDGPTLRKCLSGLESTQLH